jgi:hypothetical protein
MCEYMKLKNDRGQSCGSTFLKQVLCPLLLRWITVSSPNGWQRVRVEPKQRTGEETEGAEAPWSAEWTAKPRTSSEGTWTQRPFT